MYFILTSYVPFNLPDFLISSMINCATKGFMAYGLLLTKIFKANYVELSDESAMVVDKQIFGSLSLSTCSLHHYKLSDSPRNPSTSRKVSSSLIDLCLEIEKKMERFHDEFKAVTIGINGRLDVVQFQVNYLWNCANVNQNASTSTLSVSVDSDSVIDHLNVIFMHSPIPSDPSQSHTNLIHSLV